MFKAYRVRYTLAISNEFCEAGCGEVAWKFTEVDGEDPYGEFTTVSLPRELFSGRAVEAPNRPDRWSPPEPIGSEAFWRWFEERDD